MKAENRADKAIDLFQLWGQELAERREIRDSQLNPADMVLNRPEEVDLLVRAWFYCGRSRDLYVALFHNMNKMPILKWLTTSPPVVIQGFLEFLPWYLLLYQPRPVELQFLVSLYREELSPWYSAIAESLSQEASHYLMSRTANPSLRQLLKAPAHTEAKELYGTVLNRLSENTLPGLYGDKNKCLLQALQMSSMCSRDIQNHPGTDHMLQVIETAEAIFEAGLVPDSMAILLEAYEDGVKKGRFKGLEAGNRLYKRWSRLLLKVAPAYAMLEHGPSAAAAYRSIHKRYFPLFPDHAPTYTSLGILERLQSDSPSGPAIVASLRLWLLQISRELNQEQQAWFDAEGMIRLGLMRQLVDSLKQAQPQQAFTLAMCALWVNRSFESGLNKQSCTWLMSLCQEMWAWVPSAIFFNARLWEQLSRYLDHGDRQAGDRLLSRMSELQGDDLQFELQHRPDLFKQRDRIWERNILAGAFLGVR